MAGMTSDFCGTFDMVDEWFLSRLEPIRQVLGWSRLELISWGVHIVVRDCMRFGLADPSMAYLHTYHCARDPNQPVVWWPRVQ